MAASEESDIHILDGEMTSRDFLDSKIKELSSMVDKDPFFVADLDVVVKKYHSWRDSLPRVKPFYAVKCNPSLTITRTLSSLGTGFDCASLAEIQLVLSLGVAPSRIIFAHTCKPESHIRYASAQGVEMMTFDCPEELAKIAHWHDSAKLVLRLAVDDSKSLVRLSSKFGAKLGTCRQILVRAQKLGMEVVGVSFHVGSDCTDPLAFRKALLDARWVFNIGKELGFIMTLLDIGGGIPGHEEDIRFEEFSSTINDALDELFPADSGVQVIAEPGRYFVQAAFTLAVNVIGVKAVTEEELSPSTGKEEGPMNGSHGGDQEDSNDRTMMYYTNDGLYGSFRSIQDFYPKQISVYRHRPLQQDEPTYPSVLWGPTCDARDVILWDCAMPELQLSDWLLVDNFGAYTLCMSSNFNGFRKADVHYVVSPAWQHICSSADEGQPGVTSKHKLGQS